MSEQPERTEVKRPCPCCEGAGCEECDRTGERVTTYLDAGGGTTMRVSGSAPLSAEAAEALHAVALLLIDRLESGKR